ncbi:MAG: PAS domain S-box protein [Bacteroidales bacterium]|nr:PAS domain S-box protein [Bacteroidales bacterium]
MVTRNENLSKEELLQKLEEISRAYEALKEHYEKDTELLRKIEDGKQKSEELFRKAFLTIPDSVNINRLSDGLFVMVNEGFTKITGFTPDDVLGKTSQEINIWAEPARRKDLVKELNEKGKVEDFEALFRKKDGTIITGLMSATILEINGETHIMNVTRDITRIKKIEKELEEEKNLLHTLIDNLPDRIYIKDRNSKFVICNKALVERMGKKDISEVIGKSDFDFQLPELAEQFYRDEQEIMKTGIPLINHEEPRVLASGERRWNLTTKVPLYDPDGNIKGIVGIGRDITEIKKKEARSAALNNIIKGISTTANLDELLKLVHESLRGIVYAENCFIALYEAKTGLFSFPYFADKYDENPGKLSLARSCTSYVFRTNEPLLLDTEKLKQLTDKGEIEQIGTSSASWIGIPLNSPAGTIGVLVLQHYEEENVYSEEDINYLSSIGSQIAFAIERKMAEEEIREKNEMLQAANAEKDKFFSIIAHDLRGPLGAFMEATKILTDELPNMSGEEIREISGEMNKDASRIYALLENLLQWSRLQRGVLKFEPVEQNLSLLANNAINPLLSSAEKKNDSVDLNIPGNLMINADSHMIETVIRNLVSNAIKFTPGGKIVVSAEFDNAGHVRISVKDNGIGIPPEMKDNLFSLTSRASRPGTDGEPSSGLGLLLCREFVDKHGGRIWVESEQGKGTEFFFTLPGRMI